MKCIHRVVKDKDLKESYQFTFFCFTFMDIYDPKNITGYDSIYGERALGRIRMILNRSIRNA